MDGENPVKVDIINNTVAGYVKAGIVVNGINAYGNVIGNSTIGSGPVGVPNWAQNGIQFGYGGTGKCINNYVEANLYTGPDWGATRILIFKSDDVIVQGNTVEGCGTGIAVQAWGWVRATANNNKIDKNIVLDSQWGISIIAYDLGSGYSQEDAFAVNNKVVNNTVKRVNETVDAFVGIELWAGSEWGGGGTTPTAENNKVIHNIIDGFDVAISEDGTVKPKIHANVY